MSATRNKFSPEFRDRAVRMVAEHRGDYPLIRIRAASSPRPTSSRCWPAAKSRSAWTAGEPGETTSSSSASGERLNTRRSICEPTAVSPKPGQRSAAILASTTADARIHHLTGKHPIRPTLTCLRPRRWRHNRGGNPLTKRPETVQTNRAISNVGLKSPLETRMVEETECSGS